MKKLLLALLVVLTLSGCSNDGGTDKESLDDSVNIQIEETGIELVMNPSVDYIVAGLNQIKSVIGIELDHDGGQGENVIATIYFTSDMVDQNEFLSDETTAEKGTAGGGSIDIFENIEDAIARDEYLGKLDGKWVLDSGSHTVLGTIVIRTSTKLSDENQELLTKQIAEVLTSGSITEAMVEEAANNRAQNAELKETFSNQDNTGKIKMSIDSFELIGIGYQDAVMKLQREGFENVVVSYVEEECREEKDGKVARVTINGVENFEYMEEFLPTDEVVVFYIKAKKVIVPDIWYNLLEKHYEEVEKLFIQAGFTNVVARACEVDYNEETTFEGSVVNICIGEDNVTFEADEMFSPSVEVRIDYRVKPKTQFEHDDQPVTNDDYTEENPFIEVNDYSVRYKTEYSHYESDVARLGNSERLWITIEASPSTVSIDDFVIDYDSEMVEISNVEENVIGDKVEIVLEIVAHQSGVSEILIASCYEIYEFYENADCYCVTVKSLNNTNGQVVYVSPTGEKYHFSSNCISSGIRTTLDDALTLEYEPCSKCVG